MPRIRSIKPEVPHDAKLAKCSRDARLTFVYMIAQADDAGLLPGAPRQLLGALYPFDEDVTPALLLSWIEELVEQEIAQWRQTRDGMPVIQLVNWARHQRLDNAGKSRLADLLSPGETAALVQQVSPPEDKPRVEFVAATRGEARLGEGYGDGDGDGDGEVKPSPPPRVVLPKEATAFLAMFYEPAFTDSARKRYRDVHAQLFDVLDPMHPGPKIRGGARVKARSSEHLVDVLRVVMKDPPPDRDLAIVWLLRKLLDPPKGPSESEKAAQLDRDSSAETNHYAEALKRAALTWANDPTNREEFDTITREVDANFPRVGTSLIQKMARDYQLAQKCGVRAGFPSFEDWRANLAREKQEPAAASAV